MKTYSMIFFTWCVPGLILVVFGHLGGQLSLSHFGIALLSIGLVYYGRLKKHHRAWSNTWLALSLVYLVLGIAELIRAR